MKSQSNLKQEDRKQKNVMATSGKIHMSGTSEARLLGSAVAGISELMFFHPVDTVAKRLMHNEMRLVVMASPSTTVANFNQAIFRDASAKSPFTKAVSLFPGIGFGAAYKILQRVYKFGGQPVVVDKLRERHGAEFDAKFGHNLGRTMMSATAGSIIGIGEVALLPLDALKVKAQTAPEQLKGRGVFDIFIKEGWGLYRGAGWTAARNAPGSFALFGGNTAAKAFMGIGDDRDRATWTQDALASCAGAIASITVAQPLDVIKTRIQSRPFNSPESGMSIISNLVKNEGFGAFFKGLTPKLMVVGPKLVFSFTIAQHTIAYFTSTMKGF
uniref:Mitochondrial carrier protein n=1 Tax=Helicotheca tamesis TaxID=374047 RepID=A0A7S2IGR9_9STRA|mmetsp:Transcript_9252/g.12853  ORF Transcript_9252/g.12853 Transcript_9252/m.12853 type:complete len:328 (+) Transcript_9252:129-1112(+)|eukprot:CAMPEP_0185723858 /NCGR_PEP_ID=MMETSP1171-20130828/546_1 /TAXON_ID=374046 /ORGANISM="Helicotheca tamensis, Strain CCMP826" /LENGTH=327 /DNA_ID=CAMNT_0028391613 /DNA_START=129 /DNA_END=1112 /DNA_ORIENTATION=+